MKTGIVILNYNNATDTINCLRSLYAVTPAQSMRVIVVDNGSKKEVVEELKDFISIYVPAVTFLTLPKNIGYAQGNNEGCKLLYTDKDVDCITILNNDILFTKDIITPLSAKVRAMSDCAILSPLLMQRDGRSIDRNCARRAITLGQLFISWLLLHRNWFGILNSIACKRCMLPKKIEGHTLEIELPSGSCMVIRKSLFEQLGSFDPNTFLYYEEDILHKKILNTGLKNYIDTSVSCIHIGAATTSTQATSLFVTKCLINSTRYYLRNYTSAGWGYRTFIHIFYALFIIKKYIKQWIDK